MVATSKRGAAQRVGALAQAVRHGAIASSDSEATVGRIMMPMTSPAESALKTPGCSPNGHRSWTNGLTNVSAKKP